MIGLIAELATISIFLVVALLIVVQLFIFEGGFRLGRLAAKDSARKPESVGIVVGSMLTLMAFVVGITLSIAMGRFAERRESTLTEANAIGTAWLRTQAIGDLRAAEIAQLLERHAQLRWDFVRAGADEPLLDRINRDSAAVQAQIWSRMTALAKDRPDPIVASLMAALNETFDAGTATRFGLGFPLPQQLHRMLSVMTLLATAALAVRVNIVVARIS